MVAEAAGSGAGSRRRVKRLRRQPGGRPHAVKVLLSDEERLAVQARAVVAGVSVQRLLVESALSGSGQTASERRALVTELLGTRRLVAALGNNVNQLARVANATGQVPEELAVAAGAVVRVTARLDAAVRELTGGQR